MLAVYFPNERVVTPELFASAGLAGMEEGASQFPILAHGPDGGAGLLCSWADPRNGWQITGFRESQAWQLLPGGAAWIGWEKDKPIEAEGLKRRQTLAGGEVELNAGGRWIIPHARKLPAILGVNGPRVLATYRGYWDRCVRAMEDWFYLDGGTLSWRAPFREVFAFGCEALAINYRVTPAVVDALELLTTENAFAVVDQACQAFMIAETIERLQKKSGPPATPNLSPGGTDSIESTFRPSSIGGSSAGDA